MSIRPWLHAVEADFARETRAEEDEDAKTDVEWDESRESVLPWEEQGGWAA